ncbi:hypothetical protein BGZ60DRAFT_86914 [Tricladium varicosporioides]|nr:hypothetical protein BGZ60DRAFT_86914 [Hymenoscyphus varicosporioides]
MVTVKYEVPVQWKGKSMEGPSTANSSRASSATLPLESDDEDYDDRSGGLGESRVQDSDIQQAQQFPLAQQTEETRLHNLKRKSVDNAYDDTTTREQNHKATLMRRGHSEDVATRMARDIAQAEVQVYNRQILRPEQQNKKRLMMAKKEHDDMITNFNSNAKECTPLPHGTINESSATGKYSRDDQIQVILLEMQNKKNLRTLTDRCGHEEVSRAQCEASQDWYDAQIRILEHLNEQRLSLYQQLVNGGIGDGPFGPCNPQHEGEKFEKAVQDLRSLMEEQKLKLESGQPAVGFDGQPLYSATKDLETITHNNPPGCPNFQNQGGTAIEEYTPKYPNFEPCFNPSLANYEIQLMLLEGQNRERLLLAKPEPVNSIDTPQCLGLPRYEQDVATIRQVTRERKAYCSFLQQRPFSIKVPSITTHPVNSEPGMSTAPYYGDAIQTYTIHLMLMNLHDKLRLFAAQPTRDTNLSNQNSHINSYSRSIGQCQTKPAVHIEPQMIQHCIYGVPVAVNQTSGITMQPQHATGYQALQIYQNELVGCVQQTRTDAAGGNGADDDRNEFYTQANPASSSSTLQNYIPPSQQSRSLPVTGISSNIQGGQYAQGIARQLSDPGSISHDGQNVLGCNMLPTRGNHALQDYQMQLMLLECQNKNRNMMFAQNQEQAKLVECEKAPKAIGRLAFGDPVLDNKEDVQSVQPSSGNHALQDYQMQLMLLEQQKKKKSMQVVQAPESTRITLLPPHD